MNFAVTNLGSIRLMIGTLMIRPDSTAVISDGFAANHWSTLRSLKESGRISLTATSSDPSIEEDAAVDMGDVYSRLVIEFHDHDWNTENPIVITHKRGRYPIVQLVSDIGGDSYRVMPDENREGGYGDSETQSADIVHPSTEITHVYTNVVAGYIILLF